VSENVGYATLTVIPSAKGFGKALTGSVSPSIASSGKAGSKAYGGALVGGLAGALSPVAGVVAGAFAVKGLIKSAVSLEAAFSSTMAQVAQATNTPASQMKALDDLAIQLGKDTVYSASDASDAMLELAKSGMTAANIKGGALKSTLLLASAGGMELASSATLMSNAMNVFGIAAGDSAGVASALAGGANASSASLESLGQALQQSALGAKNAGLNLNETVGVLAAFDNAGLKGSDGGTSLKTMLASLVPQTKASATAMAALGLSFTNADGSFKSITEVADQLQTKLGGLSEAQRQQALQTIFGSDASRAASVLVQDGAAGIQKYIDATKDQTAAQAMADARMSGTAGALENLSGAWETARLQLGMFIQPAVAAFLNGLTAAINGIGPALTPLVNEGQLLAAMFHGAADAGIGFQAAFANLGGVISEFVSGGGLASALAGFNNLRSELLSSIVQALPGILEAFVAFIPQLVAFITGDLIPSIVDTIAGLGVQLSATISKVLPELVQAIAAAAPSILTAAVAAFGSILQGLLQMIPNLATTLTGMLPTLITTLLGMIPGILTAALSLFQSLVAAVLQVLPQLLSTLVAILPQVVSAIVGMLPVLIPAALNLFMGLVQGLVAAIPQLLTAIIDALPSILTTLIGMLPSLVGAAIDLFFGLVLGLLGALPKLIVALIGALPKIVSALVSMIPTLISTAVELFSKLIVGVTKNAPKIIAAIIKLIPQIVGALIDAVPKLIDAGWRLIQGFIKGIVDNAPKILSAIGRSITNVLPKFVKDALGIHSPSRVFRELGQFTGLGFALGIEDMAGRIEDASGVLAPTVPDIATPSGSLDVGQGVAGALTATAARAGGDTFNIHEAVSPEATAQEVARRQKARGA